MLGICFFTQGGENTGELIWEGEKGVGNLLGNAEFLFGSLVIFGSVV